VVGQVVKETKQEHCCTRASIPGVVHSTEVVVEHMVEMTGWLAGNETEMQRTKERCRLGRMSRGCYQEN